MYKIKFIKNPPTVENLKSIYESEAYRNLLREFNRLSKYKLDNRDEDNDSLFNRLTRIQKRYLILNISFEEVVSGFVNNREALLEYHIVATDFFNENDDNPDGEFPKGEEPDEDDKPKTIQTLGISRTALLDRFCEFYLLKADDKERLLHFLKTTRMPGAKKYAGQITKLYKQMKMKE